MNSSSGQERCSHGIIPASETLLSGVPPQIPDPGGMRRAVLNPTSHQTIIRWDSPLLNVAECSIHAMFLHGIICEAPLPMMKTILRSLRWVGPKSINLGRIL